MFNIKEYENTIAIGIIGTIAIIAMLKGIQPEIIAVAALSAIAGYIGSQINNRISNNVA